MAVERDDPANAPAIARAGIDLVFTAGPLSKHLFNALPAARRGTHAATSAVLAPLVAQAVRGGDMVMVKGSAASRMSPVIEALMALGQSSQTPADGGNAVVTLQE